MSGKKNISLHKASHDPRAAAIVALAQVLDEGADSQAALDALLSSPHLVPTDKRLCTELVYGTLRWYVYLADILHIFLAKPEKLPTEMRHALAIALYEILFLRVPHHAPVNWAAGHIHNRFGKGLAGVANGVLRSISRNKKLLPTAGTEGETSAHPDHEAANSTATPALLAQQGQTAPAHAPRDISADTPRDNASADAPRDTSADALGAMPVTSDAMPGLEHGRMPGTTADTGPNTGPDTEPNAGPAKDTKKSAATRKAKEAEKFKEHPIPPFSLATRFAMPEWIAGLWSAHYGKDAALQLMAASQDAPPSGLRLNPRKEGWQSLRAEMLHEGGKHDAALAVGDNAVAFFGPLPWQAKPLLKEGKASRQSAASFEALFALEPHTWPAPIWDCCAGRGGKTLALLEKDIPVALASDPSKRRLAGLLPEYARLFGEKAAACKTPAPRILAMDAQAPFPEEDGQPEAAGQEAARQEAPLPKRFGTILVDAPCSGLGTLARHPEIRLRRTPEDISRLAATQKDILESAWKRLLPGGKLVYLTCTVNPAENEEQVAAFLAAHPEATLCKEFRTPFDSPLREFFYGAVISAP